MQAVRYRRHKRVAYRLNPRLRGGTYTVTRRCYRGHQLSTWFTGYKSCPRQPLPRHCPWQSRSPLTSFSSNSFSLFPLCSISLYLTTTPSLLSKLKTLARTLVPNEKLLIRILSLLRQHLVANPFRSRRISTRTSMESGRETRAAFQQRTEFLPLRFLFIFCLESRIANF